MRLTAPEGAEDRPSCPSMQRCQEAPTDPSWGTALPATSCACSQSLVPWNATLPCHPTFQDREMSNVFLGLLGESGEPSWAAAAPFLYQCGVWHDGSLLDMRKWRTRTVMGVVLGT